MTSIPESSFVHTERCPPDHHHRRNEDGTRSRCNRQKSLLFLHRRKVGPSFSTESTASAWRQCRRTSFARKRLPKLPVSSSAFPVELLKPSAASGASWYRLCRRLKLLEQHRPLCFAPPWIESFIFHCWTVVTLSSRFIPHRQHEILMMRMGQNLQQYPL